MLKIGIQIVLCRSRSIGRLIQIPVPTSLCVFPLCLMTSDRHISRLGLCQVFHSAVPFAGSQLAEVFQDVRNVLLLRVAQTCCVEAHTSEISHGPISVIR